MNKLQSTRKRGDRTLIAILIIGVAVYIGFTPLFELIGGGVAGAVIGSSFGAIFVIVLTMYLLNKQTEIEQETKKSERVFDEKVKLYQYILNTTRDMIEDGSISLDEITKLPFAMINLQMLGDDSVIENYKSVFVRINDIFASSEQDIVEISSEQKMAIFDDMSIFASKCRVDLGISENEVGDDLFKETSDALKKSNDAIEGRNKPLAEKDIVAQAKASCGGSIYRIIRYKDASIRIIKDVDTDPVKNSKTIMREINEEYNLGFTEENFKKLNTRTIGKRMIDMLNKL